MLTAEEIKIALVMMNRAQCTGEEAKPVALVMDKLMEEYKKATAPQVEESED